MQPRDPHPKRPQIPRAWSKPPASQTSSPSTKQQGTLTNYGKGVIGVSLLASLLIHGLVIAIAVSWGKTEQPPSPPDFILGDPEPPVVIGSGPLRAGSRDQKQAAILKVTPWPTHSIQPPINGYTYGPTNGEYDVAMPQILSATGDDPIRFVTLNPPNPDEGASAVHAGSFSFIPPWFRHRCDRQTRLSTIERAGGNPRSEDAVCAALNYFKSKQNPDGSWGTSCKGATTGLAVLCYLSHCEMAEVGAAFGPNVFKGMMYLVELSKKNPEGIMADASQADSAPYEHAIATGVFADAYPFLRVGNRQLPGVREALEKGLRTIIHYQHADGAWGSDPQTRLYAAEGPDDLPLTVWQCFALKTGKMAGLKIDHLLDATAKAVPYLESQQTQDSGFGSTDRSAADNQWDLTGAGVYALRTMARGDSKDAALQKAIAFAVQRFQKELPNWQTAQLAHWFFYSEVFHQCGGTDWKQWNDTALPIILDHQNKDGSWHLSQKTFGGAVNSDDIYATCMCTLILETYYRYAWLRTVK